MDLLVRNTPDSRFASVMLATSGEHAVGWGSLQGINPTKAWTSRHSGMLQAEVSSKAVNEMRVGALHGRVGDEKLLHLFTRGSVQVGRRCICRRPSGVGRAVSAYYRT